MGPVQTVTPTEGVDEAELRTQARAHAMNLIDGESALPGISAASAHGMELIGTFFYVICEEWSKRGSERAADPLVADSLRTHFGGLAAAMRGLPEDARIDGQMFTPRLPDIHLFALMERITGPEPVVLRSGMEAFVHGQGLVADALAGTAPICAPGQQRAALDSAAAHVEFRSGLAGGSVRRALDAIVDR